MNRLRYTWYIFKQIPRFLKKPDPEDYVSVSDYGWFWNLEFLDWWEKGVLFSVIFRIKKYFEDEKD